MSVTVFRSHEHLSNRGDINLITFLELLAQSTVEIAQIAAVCMISEGTRATMIGNPLGDLLKESNSAKASPETLKLIEGVLDFIRANLKNIQYTWGTSSPQYKAASELMQKHFDDNMSKLDVETQNTSLEKLLGGLSLADQSR